MTKLTRLKDYKDSFAMTLRRRAARLFERFQEFIIHDTKAHLVHDPGMSLLD